MEQAVSKDHGRGFPSAPTDRHGSPKRSRVELAVHDTTSRSREQDLACGHHMGSRVPTSTRGEPRNSRSMDELECDTRKQAKASNTDHYRLVSVWKVATQTIQSRQPFLRAVSPRKRSEWVRDRQPPSGDSCSHPKCGLQSTKGKRHPRTQQLLEVFVEIDHGAW